MSLANRLAEPSYSKGGRPCPLCSLLDRLDPDERDALTGALQVPASEGGWSARVIVEALHDEGHTHIGKSTVENHRREHLT